MAGVQSGSFLLREEDSSRYKKFFVFLFIHLICEKVYRNFPFSALIKAVDIKAILLVLLGFFPLSNKIAPLFILN